MVKLLNFIWRIFPESLGSFFMQKTRWVLGKVAAYYLSSKSKKIVLLEQNEIKKMLYEHNVQLWNSDAPSPEELFRILSQFSLTSLDLICDTITIVFDPELFSLDNIVLLKNANANIKFADFNTIKVWW